MKPVLSELCSPGHRILSNMRMRRLPNTDLLELLDLPHHSLIDLLHGRLSLTADIADRLDACFPSQRGIWPLLEEQYRESLQYLIEHVDHAPQTTEIVWRAAVTIDGIIYTFPTPAGHCAIYAALPGYARPGLNSNNYITTTARVISEIEAGQLAVNARQLRSLYWPPKLYAEELFGGPR